jgi:predicted restriction endonuclease
MKVYTVYNTVTEEIVEAAMYKKDLPTAVLDKLVNNTDLDIIYPTDGAVPDIQKYRVKNGKLKKQDKDWKPQVEVYEDLIRAKTRELAINALIAEGIDPEDYV